ncbi:hypothetical protein DUNSADRAFT_16731 [Dunaliella salina]|uniref:Secreted protein n=1 Tax=Dunaliella salina TaxID=3046 RepID=A0ABQ7G311_DUNSA|nr:hypothetical protein DUNSADRAFT_16731 [Dunaliella salina]|eukprot:KAF5828986.1 hypothetical protein DUNSADRAFT_16731 [Dunaliella salina]
MLTLIKMRSLLFSLSLSLCWNSCCEFECLDRKTLCFSLRNSCWNRRLCALLQHFLEGLPACEGWNQHVDMLRHSQKNTISEEFLCGYAVSDFQVPNAAHNSISGCTAFLRTVCASTLRVAVCCGVTDAAAELIRYR